MKKRANSSLRWKWIRLAALLVLTPFLGWLSYSTWGGLLFGDVSGSGFRPNYDQLGAVVLQNQVNIYDLEFQFTAVSTSENGGASPSFGAKLFIDAVPESPDKDQVAYLVGLGRGAAVLDSCISNGFQQSSSTLTRLSPEDATSVGLPTLTGSIAPPDGNQVWYRYVWAFGNDEPLDLCDLDPAMFWAAHGSRYTYTMPESFLSVAPQYDRLADGVGASFGSAQSNSAPSMCIADTLTFGAGFSVGTSVPQSDGTLGALSWNRCNSLADANSKGVTLMRSPISVDLTDTQLADESAKSLFFAGIFGALICALLIEIFNSVFEVRDAIAERAPGAETNNPGPVDDANGTDADKAAKTALTRAALRRSVLAPGRRGRPPRKR